VALAGIGRQSSDTVQRKALAQCLSADPVSYEVVWEWMTAAMPKWGGSLRAMNKVGAYVVQHGAQNPTLYSLLAEPLGYEASQMATYPEGKEGFVAASRAGPGAQMMTNAGHAYWVQDDPWMAAVYWSQALRFWPGSQEVRAMRGRALHEARDYAWALEDLLPSAATYPDDLDIQFATGNALLSLNRIEESRPYLLRAQQQPNLEFAALESYCFTYVYSKESIRSQEARDCTGKLIRRKPRQGMFWLWRYQALAVVGDERWTAAAAQFMLYADPDDPWQQSVKKEMLASGLKPAGSANAKEAKP
jgi:tetratricopeptide (TPR) repeat protein